MRTVSSIYLKMILTNCVILGGDQAKLLSYIPNGKRDLENPSKRFSSRLAAQLINDTVEMTGRETIGLEIGTSFRPEILLDLGYAFPFCDNLREVMSMNEKYQSLVQQNGKTKLVMAEGSAWLEWSPLYTNIEFYRYFVEMIFVGYASIGRWLLWGEDNPVISMHFKHSQPKNMEIHKQLFAEKIVFNAPHDRIEFMPHTIDVPMPNRNPDMVKFLKARLDKQLSQLAAPLSVSMETLFYIQNTLAEARPTIGRVANILGMSERSLRRRLEAEDTNFRTLLETARKANCETYMHSEKHTHSDIALMLGFNDHSAYSRAFKSWFGKTPREYRTALLAD